MNTPVEIVTEALKNMGIDPAENQLPDSNGRGWLVQASSVVMFAAVGEADSYPFLHLVCPIAYMPTQELLPFYRRMLDLSMELMQLASVGLGMDRDIVCTVCQQNLEGLTPSAAEALMKRSLKAAEVAREVLLREFSSARVWVPM